jgi:hypothetical protein
LKWFQGKYSRDTDQFLKQTNGASGPGTFLVDVRWRGCENGLHFSFSSTISWQIFSQLDIHFPFQALLG